MTESQLTSLTLANVAAMIASRTVSPVEVTRAVLARTERLNGAMQALITITKDHALEAARKAEGEIARGYRLPLHGVPVSIKDLFDTKGVKTTAGAKVFAKRVPETNATVVDKLNEAGAVIIGKTNLHEFAFGVTTVNPHYGTTKNPWDQSRIAGGSSGGSACAVAAGLGFGSIGSDTGGSIRIPASLCGIAGLKPTYGRVSVHGAVPLCWSLDHVGPMARTVEDVAILLRAIAGPDSKDSYSRKVDVPDYLQALTGTIKGISIGIPREYFYENLAPDVEAAVAHALRVLEKLGAHLREIRLPNVPVHRAVWLNIASPEAYSFHEPYLKASAAEYGADVRGRLEPGRELLAVDYVRAQRTRGMMKEECLKLFREVSVIVTPTIPIAAPRIDDLDKLWAGVPETAAASLSRYTRFFNIVGFPAISIPCGFTTDGLPIGIQIAGKPFDESTVLRVSHAYEQEARWYERRPPV